MTYINIVELIQQTDAAIKQHPAKVLKDNDA